VLDAMGLTTEQMQAIAREFNYIESTFVLPPTNPAHTAQVRIFTPTREIPFAGHPNIGTAFVLAREGLTRGEEPMKRMVFEEEAGLVAIEVSWMDGVPCGAELVCPEVLSRRGEVTLEQAAACLCLEPSDIRTDGHRPQVVSVGLPFLAVELKSRDALRRARPDKAAYAKVLPLDGANSIYTYTLASDPEQADCDLQSRMFTGSMAEDPACGSGTAAVSALQAELRGRDNLQLRIRQGVDMGRPSTLLTTITRGGGSAPVVRLGGRCVAAMEGTFSLPEAA
jgi:trans-2,3-dihydro-3-hydroxyanthranilate isomerase